MATNYPQQTITTFLGLSLVGMDEVVAEDFIIIDNAFGSGGLGVTLQTNSVNNTLQSLLNLKAGANITLTADAFGGVTIASSGGAAPVTSVFGRTGAVVAVSGDYAVGQVTGAAPLASPAFTGTPTAPTPLTADSSTAIATTAFVKAQGYITASAVTSVFARTGAVVATSGDYSVGQVTGAAPLASPTFTGVPAAPTPAPSDNSTTIATTAFVTAALAAGVPWSSLLNATGNLTLANAGFSTTFGQTSAVLWKWVNTTAATTGGVNQSSPIITLGGQVFSLGATAEDDWTLQNVVANALNFTISNVAESAGSLVTLTINAITGIVAGQKFTLTGLTTATWLNNQTVTIITPSGVTVTFNDPTSHGLQASHAETGNFVQSNPTSTLTFARASTVSATYLTLSVPSTGSTIMALGSAANVGAFQLIGSGGTASATFTSTGGNSLTITTTDPNFSVGNTRVLTITGGGSGSLQFNPDLGAIASFLATGVLKFFGTSSVAGVTLTPTLDLQSGSVTNNGVTVSQLATPSTPVITNGGAAGLTTYTYVVVAVTVIGTVTAASTGGSTATGNASLTGTNFNTITWTAVPGAFQYRVYRTVGGATQGLIATVNAPTLTRNDTGLAGDSSTAPTVNTTGVITAQAGTAANPGLVVGTANQGLSAISTAILGIQTGGSIRYYTSAGSEFARFISNGGSVSGVTSLTVSSSNFGLGIIGNIQSASNVNAVLLGNNASITFTAGTIFGVQMGGVAGATLTFAPTSGNAKFIACGISPVINQTSTASGDYTVLQVNVTETAFLGTNALLMDLQVGGVSKAKVDHTGVFFSQNTAGVSAGAFTAITSITTVGGIVTALTGTSDERLKDHVPYAGGLAEILKITPASYKWNEEGSKHTGLSKDQTFVGFIAQDVQRAIPEAITATEGEKKYLSLDDRPIIAALVNAVKELTERIKVLEGKHGDIVNI